MTTVPQLLGTSAYTLCCRFALQTPFLELCCFTECCLRVGRNTHSTDTTETGKRKTTTKTYCRTGYEKRQISYSDFFPVLVHGQSRKKVHCTNFRFLAVLWGFARATVRARKTNCIGACRFCVSPFWAMAKFSTPWKLTKLQLEHDVFRTQICNMKYRHACLVVMQR